MPTRRSAQVLSRSAGASRTIRYRRSCESVHLALWALRLPAAASPDPPTLAASASPRTGPWHVPCFGDSSAAAITRRIRLEHCWEPNARTSNRFDYARSVLREDHSHNWSLLAHRPGTRRGHLLDAQAATRHHQAADTESAVHRMTPRDWWPTDAGPGSASQSRADPSRARLPSWSRVRHGFGFTIAMVSLRVLLADAASSQFLMIYSASLHLLSVTFQHQADQHRGAARVAAPHQPE